LPVYFQFAFSPLVSPWHLEEQQKGINDEFYEIDARAPAGTTIDEARVMMRTVLVSRLGLVYHLSEKSTPIYALLRRNGPLKLKPAIGTEPNPGRMRMGAFSRKSASLADFAGFLSNVAGRLVLDRTGMQGQFQFDVDWGAELQESHGDPSIVLTEVKRIGLKLEPRNEPVKILVIDHVNKMPTDLAGVAASARARDRRAKVDRR
jgi:uncharacterized protein (TIGR03435 family)